MTDKHEPSIDDQEDLILVFDGGTQSIRCGLFDVTGRMVDFIKLPIQPYFSDQPGFAEQHCEYFWEKFCEASQAIAGHESRSDRETG